MTDARRAWKLRNRERVRAQDRAAHARKRAVDYARYKHKELKAGAAQRGIAFELSRDDVRDLLARRVCELCGIECRRGTCRAERWTTPSIDRIDNTVGYLLSNVALLCYRCNARKADMSLADVERLYHWLREKLPHKPPTSA